MAHQVCNIDNKKRAKELPSGVHVDLHIVAHSLTQLPLDLMDELLPNVSGGKANVPRVVFRTDGPRVLTRGSFRVMRKEDTELFKLMARYFWKFECRFATTATVFQSKWSLNATLRLGHQPVQPVIIGNAADPDFYYPGSWDRVHAVASGKVRVKVCTAVWSDGPRKNWSLLQFLDRELDHTHYELILVGRTPANTTLLHTTVIPPMKQGPLGSLLRKMHIFLAPSYNECFSNAEVQALACGLPVLALHDSSHVEVVQEGGRFFSGEDDVLSELSALTANYAYYAQRVGANDIDDVALRYLCASRLC